MPAAPPEAADLDLDAVRARYIANLAALYPVDPQLAAAVEATPFAALAVLERARDGSFTVRLDADDGKPVYLHSRHRPREEAAALAAPHAGDEPVTFVLSGGGLGYAIEALEAARPEPTVLVCEDDLTLIKATLCLHDLAGRLRSRRVVFLWQADRTEVHRLLMPINAAILLGATVVATPAAQRRHAAFHAQMRELVTGFAAYVKTQLLTLVRTSRTTFRNLVLNLPAYLRQPGIDALRNRAAGQPAIVVAAGPSLAREIEALRAVQDRAVIVAVQTVYRLLLALGIRPHFVTSLDFHEVSAEFFRDLPPDAPGRLVAEPKATHLVLDAFPGPRFVLENDLHRALLGETCTPRGRLPAGSTVAHLAFYVARHLGCDPVIFVGQDLAFSDNVFYLPGSPVEDIWAPELGPFNPVESMHWERIARNRSILRRVGDVRGEPVLTDDLLFTYAEQFAKDIAAAPGTRVIQAGERGARLPGATALPLEEAARRFCTRPVPPDLFEHDAPPADCAAEACAALAEREEEVTAVRAIARETSDLLRRLEGLLDRPGEFNRLIGRVDDLRQEMGRHDRVYRLIVDVSPQANLRRYRDDRAIGSVASETSAVARRRLERDRAFVDALVEGCDFVLETLPLGRRRLSGDAS